MKKMMRRILPIFTLIIPFQAYAAEGERMDRIMLKAILTFLQYASWPIVAVAIGMFIYSIKNEDGASKTNAIKILIITSSESFWTLLINKKRRFKPW